jgi:threonine dehydrogenase-like Zn-dependent dehydrogenase
MKEIFKNREGLIVEEKEFVEFREGEILIKVNSCLLDIPDLIKLDVNNLNTNLISTKLQCSNVGIAKEINIPISEIKIGDNIASSISYNTDCYCLKNSSAININDKLNSEKACFIGLGAKTLHTIRKSNIELGDKVLVVGQGVVGQLSNQIAEFSGAKVLALDSEGFRLNVSEKLKINNLNLKDKNILDKIKIFSNGFSVDKIFITCLIGTTDLWELICDLLRPGGKLVIMYSQDLNLNQSCLSQKNLIIDINTTNKEWGDYFQDREIVLPDSYIRWNQKSDMQEFKNMLLNDSIKVHDLITHRFELKRTQETTTFPLGINEQHLGVLLNFV